jgi:hypothetical protein
MQPRPTLQPSSSLDTLPLPLPDVFLYIALCCRLKSYLARTSPPDLHDPPPILPANVVSFIAQALAVDQVTVQSCWATLKSYVWADGDSALSDTWGMDSSRVALAFLRHGAEHDLGEHVLSIR